MPRPKIGMKTAAIPSEPLNWRSKWKWSLYDKKLALSIYDAPLSNSFRSMAHVPEPDSDHPSYLTSPLLVQTQCKRPIVSDIGYYFSCFTYSTSYVRNKFGHLKNSIRFISVGLRSGCFMVHAH